MIQMTQPKRSPSLRADFVWTSTGNVVYSACQWGILIVLAKLGTPQAVGEYALGVAITAPAILLASLQLRSVLVSDLRQKHPFERYLSMRVTSMLIVLLAISGAAVAMKSSLRTTTLISLVALGQVFEFTSDIFYGLMQKLEMMGRIARGLMIKGPLSLLALALGMYLTRDVIGAICGLAAARAMVLVTYDARVFGEGKPGTAFLRALWPPRDAKAMRGLLWNSLPLGVILLLGSLYVNVPPYFIARSLGKRDLGIFSALASLAMAGNVIISALGQSAFLRLAKARASSPRRFLVLLFKLLAVAAALASAGILVAATAGGPILALLFRPEYSRHVDLFVWLMIASGLGYFVSLMGYAMTAIRCFKPQIPLLLCASATSLLSSAWLVSRTGLKGAVASIMIASLVYLVGAAVVLSTWRPQLAEETVRPYPELLHSANINLEPAPTANPPRAGTWGWLRSD